MKTKKKSVWFTYVGITLTGVAVVMLGWFLLRGETKVSGKWNDAETVSALSCEANGVEFNYLSYEGMDSMSAKINASFNSDELSTISLIHKINYPDDAKAKASATVTHATMNKNFGKDRLGADALNARYSAQGTTMQMNLYATRSELNTANIKYFLLDESNGNNFAYDVMKKRYTSLGFVCTDIN